MWQKKYRAKAGQLDRGAKLTPAVADFIANYADTEVVRDEWLKALKKVEEEYKLSDQD